MNIFKPSKLGLALGLAVLPGLCGLARAELVLNEILFNPPGSDAPNQYLELRGTPNLALPSGTCLVSVAGDAADNPGTLQDVFDLSGRRLGGNGLLVLLQNASPYLPASEAMVLANTGSGPGWGSGSSSSLGHRGAGGQTDLIHASVTFILLQAARLPKPGDDIDSDNDGIPDGAEFAGWTVLDSVGVLGSHGAGDIAYGAINFRRNTSPGSGALARGTIVPVGFTPGYVGRLGNLTGSTPGDWVAGDNLAGAAPGWTLGNRSSTAPASFAELPLDHLGLPNFGAPARAGVVLAPMSARLELVEGGPPGSYTLALNTRPAGGVTISLQAGPGLEVSGDSGATFAAAGAVTLADTAPRTLLVRAPLDRVVEPSPRLRRISHLVSNSLDAAQYPGTTLIPDLEVSVTEGGWLLLNELKVAQPGGQDPPWEYVEIVGPSDAVLRNVFFLALESNASKNPGKVELAVDLTGANLGGRGLLVIGAPSDPYRVTGRAAFWSVPRFDAPGGALGNGPKSFLLVSSPVAVNEGTDLDAGDNGIPEGLPEGATILDSVAFSDADASDVFYGGAVLALPQTVPDAAFRLPNRLAPQSAAAWRFGSLLRSAGGSLGFAMPSVSPGFPLGAVLTPGSENDISLAFSGVGPWSGVVGDPTNPGLEFQVSDAAGAAGSLSVTATSSDPAVVPEANLSVVTGAGGGRTLRLAPVGVGRCTVTLTVRDGARMGQLGFPYAASALGPPGGVFLMGASDGSASVAVDANCMFVGDDEDQAIRLYDRRRSGLPLAEFDFWNDLGLWGLEPGEVDVEASTRVGNRLFWLGSHSHSNLAEGRTNRMRFFATDLVGTGASARLVFVGYYKHLKEDLIDWDRGNGHGKGADYFGLAASAAENVNPKAADGFNLEALAMAPGSANAAYVGFRAPIVPAAHRTFALVVPVLNFAGLAATGGPPGSAAFGAPIELDLYGRGIRSLEGNGDGYLICAGNPGDGKNDYPLDFKLYTWTGNPADPPRQRAANLAGLQPEGIVELPPAPWTPASQVQLISDLGAKVIYGDGIPNKREPYAAFRKCRADWVALGSTVLPAPVIVSAMPDPAGLAVTWRALEGATYRLQTAADLRQAAWDDLTGDLIAPGPYATWIVAPPAGVQPRFYRVAIRAIP